MGGSDCQALARKLLARGRQDVALALCRLSHSRGAVGPPALYAALFDKVLQEATSVRGAGFGLYLDAGLTGSSGGQDALPPAVQTCMGLLREVAAVRAPHAAAHKETVASVAIELMAALRAHGLDKHTKAVSVVVAELSSGGNASRWRTKGRL